MGLDMNVYRRRYLSEHRDEEKKIKDAIEKIAGMRPCYLEEDYIYWRKANQIREWFVDNTRLEGESLKGDLSREDFERLLADINKVLGSTKLVPAKIKTGQRLEGGKWVDILEDGERLEDSSVAEEVLPTSAGFFFGSQEYDQYYWEDLVETKKNIEKLLKEDSEAQENKIYFDYVYSESW